MMKKICTILMLTIVNLSFSQDSRIFENNWYLRNVIVDGINNFPPNGNMNINFTSSTDFYAHACNTMWASVTFENNNTNFSATNYTYTLDFCNNPPAENYQNIYFPFFGNPAPIDIYNFTYNISEFQGERSLIIYSMFNQQAIYSNIMLSTNNFEKLDFSLFPNPSKDFLTINLNSGFTENTVAEFYNEIGQVCKTVNLNYDITKIELNNLESGIYFVKIKSKNDTITKKLIKI